MAYQRTPLADRFWAKVDKAGPIPHFRPDLGPCWLWTGARKSTGYGHLFGGAGRTVQAHTCSYELTHGPLSAGLEIDHLCRVKLCVNPSHLEAVSHSENLRRKPTCHLGHPYQPGSYDLINGQRRCRICRTANVQRVLVAQRKGRAAQRLARRGPRPQGFASSVSCHCGRFLSGAHVVADEAGGIQDVRGNCSRCGPDQRAHPTAVGGRWWRPDGWEEDCRQAVAI